MKICRDNYEAFLLDLMEGKLTEGQKEDLLQFLGENPDLAVDFEFDFIKVPYDAVDFPHKDDLKIGDCGQAINRANFGQFCIARLEGDLSEARTRELEVFMESNPDCAGEAVLYSRLNLVPDRSVVFPAKDAIRKKQSKMIIPGIWNLKRVFYTGVSIAASVAILITVLLSDPATSIPEVSSGTATVHPGERLTEDGHDLTPLNQGDLHDVNINRIIADIYTPLPEPLGEIRHTTPQADYPAALREQPLPGIERPGIRDLRVNTAVEPDNKISFIAGALPVIPDLYTTPYPVEYSIGNRSPVVGLIASLSNLPEISEESERLTLRQLAQAGINGLNSLGGSLFLYERKTDPSDDRVRLVFTAGPVEFRRSTSKTSE
jgi:hypothetical protein